MSRPNRTLFAISLSTLTTKPPQPSNELHANGVIQSIDLAGKTVTILGRVAPPKPQP